MTKISYKLSSVTFALKGKNILEHAGFSAYIQRNPKPKEREGCGYRLIVSATSERDVSGILEAAHIPILGKEQIS